MIAPHRVERRPPHAVLFDVNETLFSLAAMGRALEEAGAPGHALELVLARVLRDGFASTLCGSHPSFVDLLRSHVAELLGNGRNNTLDSVLAALGKLDPHPDVRPCFERLSGAGVRIATLTNGSAELTGRLLDRAELASFVERTLDVAQVGPWKPSAVPYQRACQCLELSPEHVALVATHPWDVMGARTAGLTAAWAHRERVHYPSPFPPPHVAGGSLVDVADALLALQD